jgi:uncharacterized protein
MSLHIEVSWDENKNAQNKVKHGVSFELAQTVFEDPLHSSKLDRVTGGEERWQTIGLVGNTVILLVAHTWMTSNEQEHIRIISARRATKAERRIYEHGIKFNE